MSYGDLNGGTGPGEFDGGARASPWHHGVPLRGGWILTSPVVSCVGAGYWGR